MYNVHCTCMAVEICLGLVKAQSSLNANKAHPVLPAHKTSHYQLTVLILTIIIGIYKT